MPAVMTRPLFLSPQEVADALRKTRRTVYNWIKEGKLPAEKVGSTYQITEDDLAEYAGEKIARDVFDRYAE